MPNIWEPQQYALRASSFALALLLAGAEPEELATAVYSLPVIYSCIINFLSGIDVLPLEDEMSNSVNIFCYGSLMYPEVWNLVVEGDYKQQQAQIFGYRRKKIKNEEYPGIIAAKKEDSVEGIIYFNVCNDDLKRLDLFEGNQYIRVEVNCFLSSNSYFKSHTYIINSHHQTIVDDEDWDKQQFEQNGLKKFLSKYRGFSAL